MVSTASTLSSTRVGTDIKRVISRLYSLRDILTGVPDQARAVGEVSGVTHGDHGVVDQAEVASAIDTEEGGVVDEHRGPNDKRGA